MSVTHVGDPTGGVRTGSEAPGAAGARRPCPVLPVDHRPDYWVAKNDGAPRAAMAGASGPYASAAPALLADLAIEVPADLAADAADAAAELAVLEGHARVRLGSASPAVRPMSAALLRAEVMASCQIDNLTVVARQVALAELGRPASENATAVVADLRATEVALRLADRLDEQAILATHAALMGARVGREGHAGRYRDQLVWVGGSTITPRGAAYVGPKSELVPAGMRDLAAFLQRTDLQVVAHAAIAHAQLETIHPFAEGNGCTGRALVHAMLRAQGLVTSTTAPISAGLLVDTAGYADALEAYRTGDARPIVERFAEASRFAARSGADLVDRLAERLDEDHQALAASRLRSQAPAWRVLPHLVAQPVVDARHLQDHFTMSAATAQLALAQLAAAGVLVERIGPGRDRVWQHDGVLTALEAYAASLRHD